MKNIKRILAVALVLVMALSVVGCHKKGEIAVTIGDVEFTSAYYMCALMNADSEAKAIIDEKLAEENKDKEQTEEAPEEVDYYSHKVEDKEYVQWVEDTAMKNLKKVAAYKTFAKKNKLELDEETASNADMYAEYYWSSYGYSMYFEPNGVGQATYAQYSKDMYYSNLAFEFLYGKDGEKAVAAEDVKTKIYDNFIIADMLQGSYTEEMTTEQKADLKAKFETYVDLLNKGEKTFEEVYINYNGEQEETQTEQTEETDEPKPADKYAQIIGAEGTGYESEYYDVIKGLEVGTAKLIELTDGSGLMVAFKQDITADAYYLETLDMSGRHLIADEDFDKYMEDYAKKLDVEVNDYAVKQFKVKKIVEPEYQ